MILQLIGANSSYVGGEAEQAVLAWVKINGETELILPCPPQLSCIERRNKLKTASPGCSLAVEAPLLGHFAHFCVPFLCTPLTLHLTGWSYSPELVSVLFSVSFPSEDNLDFYWTSPFADIFLTKFSLVLLYIHDNSVILTGLSRILR